jgi:hypothetical protein
MKMQALKSELKSLLLRLGYEIRPTYQPPSLKESEYYSQWVAPCPLFSPWMGHPDFNSIYQGAEAYTLVSAERCYILISLARYASYLAGDFAECGVWKGGTALMLARVLSRLYLFDQLPRFAPKGRSGKRPLIL